MTATPPFLTCIACSRALDPCLHTFGADYFAESGGPGIICCSCDWRNRHSDLCISWPRCGAVNDATGEDSKREAVGYEDVGEVYRSEVHRYILPGSHGSSGKTGRHPDKKGGKTNSIPSGLASCVADDSRPSGLTLPTPMSHTGRLSTSPERWWSIRPILLHRPRHLGGERSLGWSRHEPNEVCGRRD